MEINATYFCCRGSVGCDRVENATVFDSNAVISGSDAFQNKMPTMKTNEVFTSEDVGIGTLFNHQIYCSGEGSCHGSTLTTMNNIYCTGDTSCKNSIIYDAHSVYCSGYQSSCVLATMFNIQNLYVMGFEAADGAMVYSGDQSSTVNVYLMSYDSGLNLQIYCNETDFCNVYCMTTGACDLSTSILCYYHNCQVVCDPVNGIACPQIESVTYSPTYMPSIEPSKQPSQPTNAPSIFPTSLPTSTPTGEPSTRAPSNDPTHVPSGQPTSSTASPTQPPVELNASVSTTVSVTETNTTFTIDVSTSS